MVRILFTTFLTDSTIGEDLDEMALSPSHPLVSTETLTIKSPSDRDTVMKIEKAN